MYVQKPSKSTCVAARDVPVILGISPFQTRKELMLEKCHIKKQRPFTASMKRGVVLEEEALQEYCKTYNLNFHDVQFPGFTRHPRLAYVGGVPDGIYVIGGEPVLIEVKCPSKFTSDDCVPIFYENQIQV